MCFLYSAERCWAIPVNEPLTIGRHDSNAITIPSRYVSTFHAKIKVDTNHVSIVDLDSRNGVYLNGKRVNGVALLKDGDRLTIGSENFWYSDNETDLIVSRKDRIKVFLVRHQRSARIVLAVLPFLAIIADHNKQTIENLINLFLELIS